jgi:hypothetical protein
MIYSKIQKRISECVDLIRNGKNLIESNTDTGKQDISKIDNNMQ